MRRETNIVILSMLTLAFTGLLMVFSIGALRSPNAMLFFKHLAYLAVGLTGFLVLMRVDYHYLGAPKVRTLIVLGTVLLLALTFVPGFRLTMGGAPRWIGWRSISFQPSELAKFTLVLLLAVRLTQHQERIKNFLTGFILPFSIAGFFVGVVVLQRDLGIPFVMLATTFVIVWAAGTRQLYLLGSCVLCGSGLLPLIYLEGYRADRIRSFIDPWSYRQDDGYQLIQSLSAFAQGGFWGRGAGAGEQKLGYLPAAHTDFIYAVIGEEFGLIGTLLVLMLFVAMMYAAIRIATHAPDLFGSLLGIGITTLIIFQAIFIMSVNLGLAPTKGLPLPFVSYGGSALIVSLTMMGILVNIGLQAQEVKTEKVKRSTTVSQRRNATPPRQRPLKEAGAEV